MYAHMRTTIEIPDQMYRMAKRIAAERGTTLRELVTQAVQQEISDRSLDGSRKRRPLPAVHVPVDAPILQMTAGEIAQADGEEEIRGINEVYRRR